MHLRSFSIILRCCGTIFDHVNRENYFSDFSVNMSTRDPQNCVANNWETPVHIKTLDDVLALCDLWNLWQHFLIQIWSFLLHEMPALKVHEDVYAHDQTLQSENFLFALGTEMFFSLLDYRLLVVTLHTSCRCYQHTGNLTTVTVEFGLFLYTLLSTASTVSPVASPLKYFEAVNGSRHGVLQENWHPALIKLHNLMP